jgi:hypothetical protein
MIQIELSNGKMLAVNSYWDSGTHKGFEVAVGEDASYGDTYTLDKVLTKEQIKSVEYVIAAVIKGYLKEE